MFALIALVVLLVIGRVMGELEWSGIGAVLLIVVVAAVIMSATGSPSCVDDGCLRPD